MKTSTVKPHLKWDGFREQYQGIIKNLINNVDICNRRFAEEGEEGYLIQREAYIKEIEELKTFIKEKEIELGYYGDEQNED
ncbi:MAG: hypothetical protein H8D95_00525 [Candidatus Endolissoclinum sp.]|nr:hypothetical protein [Candidatus Endolissoclinum sp.]